MRKLAGRPRRAHGRRLTGRETVAAVNRTTGAELGDRVRLARTFLSRLLGLLGSRGLSRGEGLHLAPCGSVHSFGMRYPIDVIFLDPAGRVVGVAPDLAPNRIAPRFRTAQSVLELPAGTIARTGTAPGDVLEFRPV